MNFRFVAPCVLALASLFLAAPVLAAAARCPSHVDVRDTMTVSQFDRAGLDKLSKKQLAALNAWLSRYVQQFCAKQQRSGKSSQGQTLEPTGTGNANKASSQPPRKTQSERGQAAAPAAATNAKAANFGAPPKQKTEKIGHIESRIVGDFHGWTGSTIFRLKNGQVWKQAGPGYFRTDMKNPKVTIKKLLIGYVLMVEGYGKEVFVRRIR